MRRSCNERYCKSCFFAEKAYLGYLENIYISPNVQKKKKTKKDVTDVTATCCYSLLAAVHGVHMSQH